MGLNFSSDDNTQIANTNLVQTYAGSCNITCDNEMDSNSVNIINSKAGGVEVTQTCAVNGQCAFNVSQASLADTAFKTNLAAVSSPSLGNFDWSTTRSYQEINQYINNQTMQKCGIKSINKMNDVQLYVVNSDIEGKIILGQTGQATGSCAMQAVMDATALATGTSNQCSASGKKGKKSCGGKSNKSIGSFLIYGGLALVLFVVIMVAYRYFSKNKLPDCTPNMKPGTKCKPAKVPQEPSNYMLPSYEPQYGQNYGQDYGQNYIPVEPQYDQPQYEAPQYNTSYDQPQYSEGLDMSPYPEAQPIDPDMLEALGED